MRYYDYKYCSLSHVVKYDYFFPAQFLIFSGFNVCFAYSYVCFSLIYFLLNSKFSITIPTSGSLVFFRGTDNPVRFSRGTLSRGRYTSSHSWLPFVLGAQLCPKIALRQLFGYSLHFCPLESPLSWRPCFPSCSGLLPFRGMHLFPAP